MEERSEGFVSFGFGFSLSASPLHLGLKKIICLRLSSLNPLIGQIDVSHWSAGSRFISAVVISLVPACQVGREWLMFGSQPSSWPFLAGGQQSICTDVSAGWWAFSLCKGSASSLPPATFHLSASTSSWPSSSLYYNNYKRCATFQWDWISEFYW